MKVRRFGSLVLVLLGAVTLLGWVLAAVGQAETISGSLTWGGLVRTYRLHLPPAPAQAKPLPLVIALHGKGGDGASMEDLTLGGFNTLADRDDFAVVYPDGVDKHWNDGRGDSKYRAHRESIDDVGFISALIDRLIKERNVEKNRVYVTGMSNGAMMAHRLACELGGKIAAIAPVTGSLPAVPAYPCSPSGPVAVLLINGTADPIVPWEGGKIRLGLRRMGQVRSVADTVKFWVAHNHCTPTPVVTWQPQGGAPDGTRVRQEVYPGGQGGSEVILYAIEGGGHTWPRGYRFLPEMFIGKTSRELDANEVIWNFFKKHSMN